ncbi:MAG: trypsin-like peptidase domain-containing protein [Sneathiella sp.]|nr:trypsin-like peptidase domain-containing protein [Sneathiella sp.]
MIFLTAAFLSVGGAGAQEISKADPLIRAMNSVVSLLPVWPKDSRRLQEPEGSGVVIGDGRTIVTADHILGQSKKVYVRTASGQIMRATIIARDVSTDIALLEIPLPLPPLAIAKTVHLFDKSCAIGNSFGLGLSVTCGVISAIERSGVGFNEIEDFIQTDAAVNPGMSGGALVNATGQFIGLLSAIFTKTSDANIGVNFAVSSQLVTKVIADLQDNGTINRPRSGLRLTRHPAAEEVGTLAAKVISVSENSPERKAEIQAGDLLLSANDRRINIPADYLTALALLNPDKKLRLDVNRRGQLIEIIIEF